MYVFRIFMILLSFILSHLSIVVLLLLLSPSGEILQGVVSVCVSDCGCRVESTEGVGWENGAKIRQIDFAYMRLDNSSAHISVVR